ncbi:AAA family ATPase [Bradyrhizobium sp. DASA03120]|uniref:adenylate/guanylate cyclase domain-containing protein n=1 Tax=Bradyrhizobium sp. SMVTL-02 TaxID=3395917 RepID=UPI003F6F06CB
MQQIVDWLEKLGMSEYAPRFAENRIDFSVLRELTDQDLKELGVVLGDRRKMLRAIADIDGIEKGAATAPATAAQRRTPVTSEPISTATPPQICTAAEHSGERRHVTVMFCDLVGSTSISAQLDAEEWRDLVSAYLDAASAAVTEMGGHVAKKLGDGLMALFGYPVAQENDAERAARAALSIQRTLAALSRKGTETGKPALNARIGIETGQVVVDAAGEIYGDAPNVAARVQALAEPGTVVVTARVQRQIAGLFVAEERGKHQLKGLAESVMLYRLVRASGGGRRAGQRHLTPLVGRDEEIAMLMRRWERAKQGDGQLVLIVGEPGIGKSRLIEEFHARLRDTPHTWTEWSCSQLLQNTPLHPIAEWGRQRFGSADVPAERRLSDLENTLALIKLDPAENIPLLAPLLDIPVPPERTPVLAPEELRRRQLAAITSWLMAGARAQPIVLTLEDLHWADPTTLDVFRGIAERGAMAPLFVLLTARPEFRPPWGARSHHGVISLVPLDRQQVRHMVGELATRHALAKEVIEGLTERTGGVPLFVEEVTRLLLERGEQGGIQAIPPTLQQSLTARLDRLGPAREVAQVAAVIGRGFSYQLVRAVAKMDDEALQTALERLAEADILLVQGLPPESEYRFKHALIQDAAYENLLKSRRQALHRRTGEILRDQFAATAATEPELLAHHFTQAGLTEAAIEWWGNAGQRSLAQSALLEGTEQVRRALDQIATLPETPTLRREEIKLQVAFGNALSLTGDFVGGKESYDRALAIYTPAEHGSLTTTRSGRDVGVALLLVRSHNISVLGYRTTSRNDGERALSEARKIGHAATLMYALWLTSWLHLYSGAYTEALLLLDELAALANEKDATSFWKATEIAVRGMLCAVTGKASDAVRAITSGITSLRSIGATLYEPMYLWHLAIAYAELGQSDNALRCIDEAMDKVERSKEKWCEAELHRVAGEIVLKSLAPDTEKAERYFGRALAVARQQQATSWELRAAMSMARLWRDQGKPHQAHELLASVYGWFTEGFDMLDLKEAKALLDELEK